MTKTERNAAILKERIDGAKWGSLSAKYALSGQRCQQICIAAVKTGTTTNEQIRYVPRHA